jgi:hypothetical protein
VRRRTTPRVLVCRPQVREERPRESRPTRRAGSRVGSRGSPARQDDPHPLAASPLRPVTGGHRMDRGRT